MKISMTRRLEVELNHIRERLCADDTTLPGIVFGVIESRANELDSNGEPILMLGTIERKVTPGLAPPVIFSQNGADYALLATPDILLLKEVHLDFRNGKVVNIE